MRKVNRFVLGVVLFGFIASPGVVGAEEPSLAQVRAEIASTREVLLSQIQQIKSLVLANSIAEAKGNVERITYTIQSLEARLEENRLALTQPSSPEDLKTKRKEMEENSAELRSEKKTLEEYEEALKNLETQK